MKATRSSMTTLASVAAVIASFSRFGMARVFAPMVVVTAVLEAMPADDAGQREAGLMARAT